MDTFISIMILEGSLFNGALNRADSKAFRNNNGKADSHYEWFND